MGIRELTNRRAVLRAMEEYDRLGGENFLKRHGFGPARKYTLVHDGKEYDPKAIAGVAYSYQYPERPPMRSADFRGGVNNANAALKSMGFVVNDAPTPSTLEEELGRRLSIWNELRQAGNLTAVQRHRLRELGMYGVAEGIWVDADRTRKLDPSAPSGVTVSMLHTESSYPGDLSDHSVTYQYPRTSRPGSHDESEIEATKAAARLKLPVYLLETPRGSTPLHAVQLAWVEGWDDVTKMFLLSLGEDPPAEILSEDHSDEKPFSLEGNRSRQADRFIRVRPDQARFKFQVFQRYGARCPLSGINVPEMLEAAHLRPDSDNGSSDPRNGLPLNAALHRAFDAHLFVINPDTLDVEVRSQGPSLKHLGISQPHLRNMTKLPDPHALEWRYDHWRAKQE